MKSSPFRLKFLPELLLAVLTAGSLMPAAGAAPERLAQTVAGIDRARILKLAEDALKLAPPAITDHRATNSAGGPHDFFSQKDYYWPNRTNQSGLPYVNHDGETNPDIFSHHR